MRFQTVLSSVVSLALLSNEVIATPPACLLACVSQVTKGSTECDTLTQVGCICSKEGSSVKDCLDSICPEGDADSAYSAFQSSCSDQGADIGGSSSSSSSSSSTSSSKYADGTYTGALVQTNRGDVQVRITVSGGKITNVTAITYPNETSQSQTISAQVIPTFQSEAVKSQNADIQLVSGATETYTGFKGSLQDAINQTMSGSSTSSTQGQS